MCVAQLPKETQAAISKVLTLRDVDPGELICKQGDAGDCMYIIFWGSADVYIQLKKRNKSEDEGRYIGQRKLYGKHVANVSKV